MAFKAKAVSDLVLPVQVAAGSAAFTVELRHLTPKHYAQIREQASVQRPNADTGRIERVVDEQKFADLIFAAAVVRAVDLTPACVAEMIELDADSDAPPVDESGCIVDRAFLKFLWDEAPGFAVQVLRANDRMLTMAKIQREADLGNSAGSSAR